MDDFLGLYSLERDEIVRLVKRAEEIKKKKTLKPLLKGKTIALLFEKPSTRTRVSLDVAVTTLGGHVITLDFVTTQISRGEPLEDTGKVLSRYVDGVAARLYKQEDIEKLANASDIPVINALTDLEHPCQAIGDVLTIKEKKGTDVKVAFVGDVACNVANSLLLATTAMGMDITLVGPINAFPPHKKFVEKAQQWGNVTITDSFDGVVGADVIYTDVWVSMGFEAEKEERMKAFTPYQVNDNLLKKAKKDAIVMHCLPAKRGLEITADVLEGKQSVVFDQAANRVPSQQAILLELIR